MLVFKELLGPGGVPTSDGWVVQDRHLVVFEKDRLNCTGIALFCKLAFVCEALGKLGRVVASFLISSWFCG